MRCGGPIYGIAMALTMLTAAGCEQDQAQIADRTPITPTITPSTSEQAMPVVDTRAWAWTSRPLLMFADSPQRSALNEQRHAIKQQSEGLTDRDMVVVEIVGDQITIDGEPREADAASLRSRYDIDPGDAFTVLLVGKDTGVKLRRDVPVTMDEVFGLIDSMPMRRQEMRNASR